MKPIKQLSAPPQIEPQPGTAQFGPSRTDELVTEIGVPDDLPVTWQAAETPEEEAIWAMLPFVFFAALLVGAALGGLRIVRVLRNMRSEAVVLRLCEARAARQSWQEREREDERRKEKVRLLQTYLHSACSDFSYAAARHNGCVSRFKSVGECMALLPDLVHGRVLDAANAQLLESNVPHLTIAAGTLRTKEAERARREYLDLASPPPFLGPKVTIRAPNSSSLN